jgi:hypothetical protein
MSLVVDIYNRLHSRDELVTCTSCGRMLFIPEDLPPDVAVHKANVAAPKQPRAKREPRGGKGVGAAVNRQSSAEDVVNSVTIEDDAPAPTSEAQAEATADTPPGA